MFIEDSNGISPAARVVALEAQLAVQKTDYEAEITRLYQQQVVIHELSHKSLKGLAEHFTAEHKHLDLLKATNSALQLELKKKDALLAEKQILLDEAVKVPARKCCLIQ